jgi:hypothetical protein
VVDGGSSRHQGDTLIVMSYDGFLPPSMIVMNSIGLWARFYDLPIALRKVDYV